MNLLHDPILEVRFSSGTGWFSMPEVYKLLQDDEVESFEALQVHQEQAWHSFLAQLGAIVSEERGLPQSTEEWREAFLEQASEEAWSIHTDDLRKPAFLQPPVEDEETIENWSYSSAAGDDILFLSKNHALKQHRITDPEPQHWVYFLVNLQTQCGYVPHYSGTVRMNGGSAARPFFGLLPSARWGPGVLSDVELLIEEASSISENLSFDYQREHNPLLWTLSREEGELNIEEQHPLFIDCPRRVRFDGTHMRYTTDWNGRIDDEGITNGQTGDPWAPVDEAENKVLNPGRKDFGYRSLAEILFGENYRLPLSFEKEIDGYVYCAAVSGGQGKRPDYQSRLLPFSGGPDNIFGPDTPTADLAKGRLERASEVESILSHVADELGIDANEEWSGPLGSEKGVRSFYRGQVDEVFFDRLLQPVQDESHKQRLREFWDRTLREIAEEVYRELQNRAPAISSEDPKWKRLGTAEDVFRNRMNNALEYA